MSRLSHKDFQILYITEGCYRLSIRKPFFKFFYRWVPVTYQEAENTDPKKLEFNTFDEAVGFIENIVD